MATKEVNEFDVIMTMSDLGKHVGKWVALVGTRIVATGDSGKTVFKEAKKKHPDRELFIMRVPRNEVMIL